MNYLAIFQAYTNTHSDDIDRLMRLYEKHWALMVSLG